MPLSTRLAQTLPWGPSPSATPRCHSSAGRGRTADHRDPGARSQLPGPAKSGDRSPGRGNTTNKGSGNKSRIHLEAGKAYWAETMALSSAWGQAQGSACCRGKAGQGHGSLGFLPQLCQLRCLWPWASRLASLGLSFLIYQSDTTQVTETVNKMRRKWWNGPGSEKKCRMSCETWP